MTMNQSKTHHYYLRQKITTTAPKSMSTIKITTPKSQKKIKNTLFGLQKASGLFNIDSDKDTLMPNIEPTVSVETPTLISSNPLLRISSSMDLDCEKLVDLEDFLDYSYPLSESIVLSDSYDTQSVQKFDKLPYEHQESYSSLFNYNDINLLTPTTENLCFDFLKSIENETIAEEEAFNKTYATLEPVQSNSSLNNSSTNVSLIDTLADRSVVSLDHDYSILPKKRTNSVVSDESSISDFTFQTPSIPESTPKVKKQRTKGIYRADDVTNDQDLKNYLERRRKNNLSSKMSRLSKKNYYVEMESKCKQLAEQNVKFKEIIGELTDITKLMKDTLLKKFNS